MWLKGRKEGKQSDEGTFKREEIQVAADELEPTVHHLPFSFLYLQFAMVK